MTELDERFLVRGKKSHDGKWVCGFVTLVIDGFTGQPTHIICVADDNGRITENGWIVPETLGRYTGLKDKNEKRIFEGDIVADQYRRIKNYYSIVWSGGGFCRKSEKADHYSFNCLNCKEFEVIGNIHDNPELLEGEKNA